MTIKAFRSLSIGDQLKFVGNDPAKIIVTNVYMRVTGNDAQSYATLWDGTRQTTVREDDEVRNLIFPFDAALPQPDAATRMMYA